MRNIQGYLDVTPGDVKKIYKFAYRHAYDRIMKSVRARDIMTREVITVRRATPLAEVAEVMASRGISGMPVMEDDGRIAGVISGKDFLVNMGAKDKMNFMAVIAECLKGRKCVSMPISRKKAEDIMTSPAITAEENTTVSEIASIFSSKKINRVPVIGKSGDLIGIVSRADIVRAATIKIRTQ
jgi:CBS domain-containing protein